MVLLAIVMTTAACGGVSSRTSHAHGDASPPGDIPDTQAFVEFRSPDGRYTITVPEGWARTRQPAGATFTDKLNSIRIDVRTATVAPTPSSVRADQVPELERTAPAFRLDQVTTVHRPAGNAILIAYQARSARDPVTGKRRPQDVEIYEFWNGGLLATITLSSPHGADNVDPWRTVTRSFAWTA